MSLREAQSSFPAKRAQIGRGGQTAIPRPQQEPFLVVEPPGPEGHAQATKVWVLKAEASVEPTFAQLNCNLHDEILRSQPMA